MVEFSMQRFDLVASSTSKSSALVRFQAPRLVNIIIFLLAFSVHRQAQSHGIHAKFPTALSSVTLEKCSGSCTVRKTITLNLNCKTLSLSPWPNPTKRCMNLRGAGSEWTAYVDPSSGSTYYYNSATQETSWTIPTTADLAGEPPVTEKQQADNAATTATDVQAAAAVGAVQPQPASAAHAITSHSSAVRGSFPLAAATAPHSPVAAGGATAQPSQQAPLAAGPETAGAPRAEVRCASRCHVWHDVGIRQ
jgi:hypothetical protein